ncbi:MAG: type II toxin-antitoxin system RelE/ParE family toxin [Bryobacteraceae bacterium]
MKVVWSRKAIRHLIALRKYIAKDSEQNAVLIAGRILDAVDLLIAHPQIGRAGRVFGTRELIVPGMPYVIPYRVRGEHLEILAIFHGRREWPAKS